MKKKIEILLTEEQEKMPEEMEEAGSEERGIKRQPILSVNYL